MTNQNVLPLDVAKEESANWRAIANEKFGEGYIKAFNIPLVDLTQILAEGATSVRAYLAASEDGEKKLLLVGVDAQGNDMIDYENGQYVFDFTTPCPPTCAPNSPLN